MKAQVLFHCDEKLSTLAINIERSHSEREREKVKENGEKETERWRSEIRHVEGVREEKKEREKGRDGEK